MAEFWNKIPKLTQEEIDNLTRTSQYVLKKMNSMSDKTLTTTVLLPVPSASTKSLPEHSFPGYLNAQPNHKIDQLLL